MKRTVVHTMMFASIAAGLVGCQSGPHWAWWKPWEKSSTETAVAANPAAPALPSASATPQAVAASGLQPAASPSATNLAGTGSALAASPLGVQPASSSTITNAPLASYPTTGAPPISDIPPSSVASTTPAAAGSISPLSTTPTTSSLAATRPAATLASVPAAGPYDPNGYQPSASLAASQPTGTNASTADRYGSYATTATAPSIPPVSTPATTPIPSAAPVDRYAMSSVSVAQVASTTAPDDRYSNTVPASSGTINAPVGTTASDPYGPSPNSAAISPPATGFASQSAPGGPVASMAPASLSSTPPNNYAAEPMAAAPTTTTASATVQVQSPAGQYRPGGTSSYSGGNRIDVASRPGAPAVSPTSAPQPASPISDPWAPQPTAPTSTAPARTAGGVSAGGSVF